MLHYGVESLLHRSLQQRSYALYQAVNQVPVPENVKLKERESSTAPAFVCDESASGYVSNLRGKAITPRTFDYLTRRVKLKAVRVRCTVYFMI